GWPRDWSSGVCSSDLGIHRESARGLAATAQNTALGVLLSLPERSFYPHYDETARRLAVNAVEEQAAAGGIMWVSGHMYLLPILRSEERRVGKECGCGR